MNRVKEKVWNIDIVLEELKTFPQTYNTILGDLCSDGTCQTILRRKLNKLCKGGFICKTSIPGTRFGQAIYYTHPKKYYILVEANRMGSNVFVFFDYKKNGKFYLNVKQCWKLENNIWKKNKNKIFFEGNVLKFI